MPKVSNPERVCLRCVWVLDMWTSKIKCTGCYNLHKEWGHFDNCLSVHSLYTQVWNAVWQRWNMYISILRYTRVWNALWESCSMLRSEVLYGSTAVYIHLKCCMALLHRSPVWNAVWLLCSIPRSKMLFGMAALKCIWQHSGLKWYQKKTASTLCSDTLCGNIEVPQVLKYCRQGYRAL